MRNGDDCLESVKCVLIILNMADMKHYRTWPPPYSLKLRGGFHVPFCDFEGINLLRESKGGEERIDLVKSI